MSPPLIKEGSGFEVYRLVVDSMFICYFVYFDLEVEIFFEKDGQQNKEFSFSNKGLSF